MNSVWADFGRLIFHVEVTLEDPNGGPPPQSRPSATSSSSTARGQVTYSGGSSAGSSALAMAAAGADETYGEEPEMPLMPVVEQRRVDESEQIGRNDPCWCGSGKKFKKCHGA
jgi:preprotein translocase subunit SecA